VDCVPGYDKVGADCRGCGGTCKLPENIPCLAGECVFISSDLDWGAGRCKPFQPVCTDGCKSWYDGCNTCKCNDNGTQVGCTRMYCETTLPNRCKDNDPCIVVDCIPSYDLVDAVNGCGGTCESRFNCRTREWLWTEEKKAWCCEYENLGCDSKPVQPVCCQAVTFPCNACNDGMSLKQYCKTLSSKKTKRACKKELKRLGG